MHHQNIHIYDREYDKTIFFILVRINQTQHRQFYYKKKIIINQ